MFLSVFDIFKIGIGPSSSHTVGPMVAARRFVAEDLAPLAGRARRLAVSLHGSLAFTGKGHGTDSAIALGLAGERPDAVDPDHVPCILAELETERKLSAIGHPEVAFDPKTDIEFAYGPALPGHANGMIFRALDEAGNVLAERTFYSVGGGFVLSAEELARAEQDAASPTPAQATDVPYPFATARRDARDGRGVRALHRRDEARQREGARAGRSTSMPALDRIWAAMELLHQPRADASPARCRAA